MLKKTILFILFLVILFTGSYAQNQSSYDSLKNAAAYLPKVKYTDTLSPYPAEKKRFWRASGELMLAQIIPFSVNLFIRKADFAKISFESIAHNLKPSSWEWDDNKFNTNQFAHPYQGSMYYSAFRSNGYSFWQSVPAAMAGSFMWEVAGETHNPAPNDFINTSLGGITLGEMTYRVSNMIVDNRQTGFNRQFHEVLAFIVNPMNGLNRILDGKWGKRMQNPADWRPSRVTGEIDLGGRRFNVRGDDDIINKGRNELYARLKLQYGNPFEDIAKPFSNFNLTMELGNNDSAKINTLRVNGFIHGWKFADTSHGRHILNITINYDFYKNSAFYYGAQSVNANLLSAFKTGKKTRIETMAGAGLIVLAAVPDAYLYYGEGRNYDYGPGFSLMADAKLLVADKLTYSINYRGGWFTTINGNKSSFFLNTVTSELRYYFVPAFSLGAEWGHLNLHGYYKEHPDVNEKYPYVRLSVGWRFGM